jgi:hypothetical protein
MQSLESWVTRWRIQSRLKGCLINVLRILLTVLLFSVAIAYTFSLIQLDLNIILIFVLILFLWFTPTISRYFEGFELSREGSKVALSVTMANLRGIAQRAEEANLLQTPQNLEEIERFVQISAINPNAALIALRTDVERKLQQIVEAYGMDTSNIRMQSMGELLQVLQREKILSREEAIVLRELRATLNKVVHTIDTPPEIIQWAVDNAPFILTALEKKLVDIKSKKQTYDPS